MGVKPTDSVSVSPGAIWVSSGSAVVAVNAPPTGGFDLKIVIATPPVFETVKDRCACRPMATPPKPSASGVI